MADNRSSWKVSLDIADQHPDEAMDEAAEAADAVVFTQRALCHDCVDLKK